MDLRPLCGLVQLVIAPHFYCPGVSLATECYAGPSQWLGFDQTVGYLSVAPGFCDTKTNKCKVWPPLASAPTPITRHCMVQPGFFLYSCIMLALMASACMP